MAKSRIIRAMLAGVKNSNKDQPLDRLMLFHDDGTPMSPDLMSVLARVIHKFEGRTMYISGHSFFASTSGATKRIWESIQSRLGMSTAIVDAVSSTRIGQHSLSVLGGATAYPLRSRRIPFICCMRNDAALGDTAANRRGVAYAWRAFLSAVSASAAVPANDRAFVYSANWTTVAAANRSTSGLRFTTSTVGSWLEFNFTGTDVDLMLVAKNTAGGIISIEEDGEELQVVDLTAPVADPECGFVVQIRDLDPGTHTIRVTLDAGTEMTVDGYRIPAQDPVPVIAFLESYTLLPKAGVPDDLNDVVDVLRPIVAGVCAEFDNVYLADFEPGWDAATMTVDHTHPNDLGREHVANRAMQVMADIPMTPGLSVLRVDLEEAIYVTPAGPPIPIGGQNGVGELYAQVLALTANGLTSLGGRAILDWTAPTSAPAIADYDVEYRTADVGSGPGAWTSYADGVSSATDAIVTGLTNGTKYEFRARSHDAGGTLPWSLITSAFVGAVTYADDFTRADANVPGSTPTGAAAWTVLATSGNTPGSYGIRNNKLAPLSAAAPAGPNLAVVDVGGNVGIFQLRAGTQGALSGPAFRVVDAANCYRIVITSGGIVKVRRYLTGSAADVGPDGILASTFGGSLAGKLVTVVLGAANACTVYVDGVLAIPTQALASHATGTKFGVYMSTETGESSGVDDFAFAA